MTGPPSGGLCHAGMRPRQAALQRKSSIPHLPALTQRKVDVRYSGILASSDNRKWGNGHVDYKR
jgi:hypothetical protein